VDLHLLLLDMSAVDFLGSSAPRVFVRSASSLMRKQKKLILFVAQPPVEKTHVVSGFVSAIPLVQTLDEAKAAIGALMTFPGRSHLAFRRLDHCGKGITGDNCLEARSAEPNVARPFKAGFRK
jgi:hypothetical protein